MFIWHAYYNKHKGFVHSVYFTCGPTTSITTTVTALAVTDHFYTHLDFILILFLF